VSFARRTNHLSYIHQEGEDYPISPKWWRKIGRFYNRATHTADWIAKNVTSGGEESDYDVDEEEEEEQDEEQDAGGGGGDEEDAATTVAAADVAELVFGEGSGGRPKVLTLHEQLPLGAEEQQGRQPLKLRWEVASCGAVAAGGAASAGTDAAAAASATGAAATGSVAAGKVFSVEGLLTAGALSNLARYFQQATVWHYPANPTVKGGGTDDGIPNGGGYVRTHMPCLASDLLVQVEVALQEMLAGAFLEQQPAPTNASSHPPRQWRLIDVLAAKRIPPANESGLGEGRAGGGGGVALLDLLLPEERRQIEKERSDDEQIRVTIRIGGGPHSVGFTLEDAYSGLVFQPVEGRSPIRAPLWHNRALVYDGRLAHRAKHYHLLGQAAALPYHEWPVDLTFSFERETA
jgi:hypothetical protein